MVCAVYILNQQVNLKNDQQPKDNTAYLMTCNCEQVKKQEDTASQKQNPCDNNQVETFKYHIFRVCDRVKPELNQALWLLC